ncbi:histidine kinase N-terminal 7TM domain-containing protein [Bacteroidota bacterium]
MKDFIFTPYSLLFLASSLVSFFASFIAWQRKNERGARELSFLMMSAGLWAFFVIPETAATVLVDKIFWSKVAYIGALSTPVLFLLFVARITGNDKFITRWNIIKLSAIPVIVFILALTNDYHKLIWTGFAPISPETNLTQYFHGLGFWIGYFSYSYILLSISSVLLFKLSISKIKHFKAQARAILLALLCPWFASVLYVSGSNPVPGFDLVPLSMIVSGTLLSVAIFRNRLLDLAPVARETLIETLKDGILVIDRHDRIQDINKSALNYLGINQPNIVGNDFYSLNIFYRRLSDAILSSEKNQMVEVEEGSGKRFYSVTKQEIKNYPGSRLVVIRDKSDEIQREKDLMFAMKRAEESDRLKSSFVANLSHEIRTPINVITGFLEVLNQDDIKKEEQVVYVDLLRKNTDRILATLNDIIEISKIEAGQAVLTETQINLNEIMDFLYNIFKKESDVKGLELECVKSLENREALITIDRPKLVTILTNLLKNSLKFTEKGEISFGYRLDNDKLIFYVKDSGIGIPENRKEMIFNRFVQAEQTMNRPYEGAGLGLSIVKAYVEMLGGRIMVNSTEGSGSEFYFSIRYKPVVIPTNL